MVRLLILSLAMLGLQDGWKKFNGDGYSLSYPEKWTQQAAMMGATVFMAPKEGESDPFPESVNVLSQDLSAQPGMTLQSYVDLNMQQLKMMTGGQDVKAEDAKLAGEPAKILQYTIPKNPAQGLAIDLSIWQIMALKDGKAYIFTYTSEPSKTEQYKPTVEQMVKSFKFVVKIQGK